MHDQSALDALRAYWAAPIERMSALPLQETAAHRRLLHAAVDELRAEGLTAERMLMSIKRLHDNAATRPAHSPAWPELASWCLQRYFRSHQSSEASHTHDVQRDLR